MNVKDKSELQAGEIQKPVVWVFCYSLLSNIASFCLSKVVLMD